MARKLKYHRDALAFYRHRNQVSEKDRQQIVVGKKCGLFGGRAEDAEEFHKAKIAKLCLAIEAERDKRALQNSGTAFVAFASRLQVYRCVDEADFKEVALDRNRISDAERVKWQIMRWKIKQAPSQGEILWENLYKHETHSRIKSYVLLVILLFVCIILVTPAILVSKLTPIIKALKDSIGQYGVFEQIFASILEHFSSLMTLAFNLAIVPQAIALVSQFDDHRTLSERELSVMKRNFFFQFVITIFLQLTVQTSILQFILSLHSSSFLSWPEMLGKNLVDNGFVFLKYTIQAAFFSNGIMLLDISHQFIRCLNKMKHKRANKLVLNPKPYVDDVPFDLGPRQAQSLVMFAMGLFFSGTSPLQSLFTFMYFLISYWIVKYNIAFVYNKQYDGVGVIWQPMMPMMLTVLYIFQLLLIGYFSLQNARFSLGGLCFVAAQTAVILWLKAWGEQKRRQDALEIAIMEQQAEEEEQPAPEVSAAEGHKADLEEAK